MSRKSESLFFFSSAPVTRLHWCTFVHACARLRRYETPLALCPRTSRASSSGFGAICSCERQVSALTNQSRLELLEFGDLEFNQQFKYSGNRSKKTTTNKQKSGGKESNRLRPEHARTHALRIGLQKHTRSPRALASPRAASRPPPPSSEHRVRAAAESPT